VEGLAEEELDAAQSNGSGGPGVVPDIFHPQEVLAEFFLGDKVGRLVVMVGKLTNGPQVTFLGPFRHAVELQVFEHTLT